MQRYANDLDPSGYEWDLKFHYKSGRYTAREHARFHTVSTYVLGIFRIQEVKIEERKSTLGENSHPCKYSKECFRS